MCRTLAKCLMLAALVAILAAPASAYWTFQFHDLGSVKICTGEPNDPSYAPICLVLTPWGDEIGTKYFQGFCRASICCANGSSAGFCYSCPASETSRGGMFPGVCWAQSQSGSNYNSNYAWCKSDAVGQWKGDCDGGWR